MLKPKIGQIVLLKTYEEMKRENVPTIGLPSNYFGKYVTITFLSRDNETFLSEGYWYDLKAIKCSFKPKFITIEEKT